MARADMESATVLRQSLRTAGNKLPEELSASRFLVGLGFAYLVTMAWLAKRYWFSVPFRGLASAAALYAMGIAANAA